MLCLCPYWFKYDGSWMNGRLSGPVNMILPNHVYLGTFYDSLVSINSYEICVDRDPLVCAEMTGIKQVTCNITGGGGGGGGKWKRDFSLQSPPKLFQTKCSVFPNSNVLCHLKNMVFITAIKKWKCNQVKL